MARRAVAPFSHILCPVDFSAHARSALRYAAAVAARSGGALTALYVNDPFLVSAAAAAYNDRTLAAQSRAELTRFVRRALGPHGGGSVAASVAMGEPSHEIQRAARKARAGLIVVGSEGLSGARRLFFGSTTARVLMRTTVPVLAVPPAGPASGPDKSWPGGCILAAIDLASRGASSDVETAAAIARWFGARLVLVHVVEKTRAPRWLSLRPAAHHREQVERARARLERLAAGVDLSAPVEAHVLVGDPPDQIAACAGDVGAGLLVATLRGDDRIFGDRKGATTYRVVCEAGTPVLAVPEGWTLRP